MRSRVHRLVVLAAIFSIVSGSFAPAPGAEIIAHRGASHDAPENTLAAARIAFEQGADVLELDVHLSLDGEIVVLHDNNTRRTTGYNRRVSRQTLDELRTLDAGAWKGAEWAGERIPTLAEILAVVPDDKRVFIDLKVGREIVPELACTLRESGFPPERTVVIAFSLRTLEAVKLALPEVQVYWLVQARQHPESGDWMPSADNVLRRAQEAGVDGINMKMADVIDHDYVEQFHEAGLGFYVWTVNSAEEAHRALCAGVDGITTDRPGWLREQLHRLPACGAIGQ